MANRSVEFNGEPLVEGDVVIHKTRSGLFALHGVSAAMDFPVHRLAETLEVAQRLAQELCWHGGKVWYSDPTAPTPVVCEKGLTTPSRSPKS